ncbi:MAG: hypothetical protein CL760_05875 [Chloroflexi bacterium]|nr:hypothetical protein [Chloroflexota bacterium]|tara:strand:- start:1098 stop:1571 length:474 start_codon:yes stop_codon:yes gene_type:complete
MDNMKSISLLAASALFSSSVLAADFVIPVSGNYTSKKLDETDPGDQPQQGEIHKETLNIRESFYERRVFTIEEGFIGNDIEFKTEDGTGDVVLYVGLNGNDEPSTGRNDCESDKDLGGSLTNEVCVLEDLVVGEVYTVDIYVYEKTDNVVFTATLIN